MNTNTKRILFTVLILIFSAFFATTALANTFDTAQGAPGGDDNMPPGVSTEEPAQEGEDAEDAPPATETTVQLPPDLVGLTETPPINDPPSDPNATEEAPDILSTEGPPIGTPAPEDDTEDTVEATADDDAETDLEETPVETVVVTPEPTQEVITPEPTLESLPVVEAEADEAEGNTGAFTPEFAWVLSTNGQGILITADWYNIIVTRDDTIVIDEWLASDDVCFINQCTFTPAADLMPAGFINGDYSWWVRSYDLALRTTSAWSAEQTFVVNRPAPQVATVNAAAAENSLTLMFNEDANATWFQVYVGNARVGAVHLAWYAKADAICDNGNCTVSIDSYIPDGRYDVAIQTWGPGGYAVNAMDGWSAPIEVTIGTPAPKLASDLQTISNNPAIFTWAHSDGATEYQVWIGTQDDKTVAHYATHRADDLNCNNGVCTLNLTLTAGETYLWYVLAQNAAGTPDGGIQGWAEGPVLTVP